MQEIAYLSFKKSKIFWGHAPRPSRSSHLRWSTQLSQNPSYSLICCPHEVYLSVKPCIYMLVAAVMQTCRLELLQVPR
jgi:hypothetical protein